MFRSKNIKLTLAALCAAAFALSAVFALVQPHRPGAVKASAQAGYELDMSGAPTDKLRFAEVIGDFMMFQQNKPVKVWGFAPAGSAVAVTLSKQDGTDAETLTATADEEGYFAAEFAAKQASFTEYKITAVSSAEEISAEHILFGELFLSCGQSNMALNVQYCSNASEIIDNADNPYIRVFMSPEIPGKAELPYFPAAYYEGGVWAKGDSGIAVQGASAVSYNFALDLFEKLNVNGKQIPVGFLNTAKGATSIEAWLSRPSIENDEAVKSYLDERGRLLDEEEYNQAGANNYNQVSAMFNSKIAPLSNLYIAGILWYQGENNVGNEIAGQYYKNALSLMMKDWSMWFNGGTEEIPFIFAQITPHNYGYEPEALAYMWEGMAEAYLQNKAQCSMITTYDIPLDWYNEDFAYRSPIHPIVKKPVGERMAYVAYNRIYGGTGEVSAPVYSSFRTENKKMILTFENAESLKTANGLPPVGFALCGENRVFYPAEATVNADGTVTLESQWVKEPIAATYAFSTMISSANLCGENGLPVAPFRTDKTASVYYHPKDWQNCDSLQFFVSKGSGTSEDMARMLDAYTASQTAALSVSERGDYGGAVKIDYTLRGRESFYFSPILSQSGVFEQFANYDTLLFKVKNAQQRNVTLERVEVTLSDGRKGNLTLSDGSGISAEIAKEAQEFQTFSYSLNTITDENGNKTDIASVRALIKDIRIYFKDYMSGAIEIDSFSYGNIADYAGNEKEDENVPPVDPKPEESGCRGCKSSAGGESAMLFTLSLVFITYVLYRNRRKI